MAEQTPQGMFVVHVRSDSDLGRGHVVGRVEHVMSGDDEIFGSLEALLAFMKTHVAHADTRDDAKRGGDSNETT
jgi:hypothetical protein